MKEEVQELIAERVPPGDRWKILEGDKIHDSLLETISEFQRATGFSGAYRFEPRKGKLYALKEQQKKQPYYLDIYGEES